MTDINELCRQLGCTSRTLRFYEEKGLIESTKETYANRRKYTEEQIINIKNVLVLRSLGLPVAKIKEYLSNNIPLADIIKERKADLIASMADLNREYGLLCEALSTVENGGDIFSEQDTEKLLTDKRHIASIFTDLFVSGDYRRCFDHFSVLLKEYLPLSAFTKAATDTLKLTGCILSDTANIYHEQNSNTFYGNIKCEKQDLCIKLVVFSDKIQGIWLTL
ncbi:MAG: MerR family transcriptional regulator [Clostridia bacterium]|nr:MerR family transcriptional regulator [Clostridia bacterium]